MACILATLFSMTGHGISKDFITITRHSSIRGLYRIVAHATFDIYKFTFDNYSSNCTGSDGSKTRLNMIHKLISKEKLMKEKILIICQATRVYVYDNPPLPWAIPSAPDHDSLVVEYE